MVTMKIKMVAAAVLLVAAGYFAGFLQGRRSAVAEGQMRAALPVGKAQVPTQAVAFQSESPGSSESPAITQDTEALQILAQFRDRHPAAVKINVLKHRAKIDDGFAALLGLTSSQVDALNGALRSARERLNALSARYATVSVDDNGVIRIAVMPFEEGPAVYDQLMESFASTIGKERSDAVKKLLGDQFVESFHNFGAEQRSLTIARTLPRYVDWKDGGFYIKDDRKGPHGVTTTTTARVFPDRLQFLLPNLEWLAPVIVANLSGLGLDLSRSSQPGIHPEVTSP
jgi:hypothetical protein